MLPANIGREHFFLIYLCAVCSVFKDLRGLLFCPLYLIAEKTAKIPPLLKKINYPVYLV